MRIQKDTTLAIIMILVGGVMMLMPQKDDQDKDTDFPAPHQVKVAVTISDPYSLMSIEYPDCVLLGEKVEC